MKYDIDHVIGAISAVGIALGLIARAFGIV